MPSLGVLLAACVGLGMLWVGCAWDVMGLGVGAPVPLTRVSGTAVLLPDERDYSLDVLRRAYEGVYGAELPVYGADGDVRASLPRLYNLGVRKGGTGSLVRVLSAAGLALKSPGGSAETHFWSRLHRALVDGNGESARARDLGSQFLKHVEEAARGTVTAAEGEATGPFDLYGSLFPAPPESSDNGDANHAVRFHVDKSTENWCAPALPQLLRAVQPTARLSVLLRDPVARAYSDAAFTARVQRRRARDTEDDVGGDDEIIASGGGHARLRRLGLGPGLDPGDNSTSWDLPAWFHALVEPAISDLGGPGAPLSERALGDACTGGAVGSPDAADPGLAFVLRGVYAPALERWARVWGQEAVLVLRTEELSADPEGLVRRVAAHAGVPASALDAQLPGWGARAAAAAKTPFTHCDAEKDPTCAAPPPPMTPATRALLAAFYAPWNERLAAVAHDPAFLLWNTNTE